MRVTNKFEDTETGSAELIVLGLVAALIVALAIPVFFGNPESKPTSPKAKPPISEPVKAE